MTTMTTIEITPENRDLYGGDIEITSTVPAKHPKMNIPLSGLRRDVRGAAMQFRTFYKGDIIFKNDPTLNYNFTWWPDDGSNESRRLYMLYKLEKGFTECEAKDWDLRPELRQFIKEVNGRLVIQARRNIAGIDEFEVLMYRSEAEWLKARAAMQMVKDIKSKSDRDIAQHIEGTGVEVMPTTVETTTERFNIDSIGLK